MGEKLAEPLQGRALRAAAAAVIDVVNHAMAEALKIVSVQRGHDPREFILAAFGGAGPMHAAALAEELGMAEVVCPPIPGAFSALGLVGSDLKRDYVRTVYTTTATAEPADLEAAFQRLEQEGAAMLDRARVEAPQRRFVRSVDARYGRQSYELAVPVPGRRLDAAGLAAVAEDFHARHRRTYGHDNRSEPVQLVNLRVAAIGSIAPLRLRQTPAAPGTDPAKGRRRAWFGAARHEAAVLDRARMPAGFTVVGPAVIEALEVDHSVATKVAGPHGRERLRLARARARPGRWPMKDAPAASRSRLIRDRQEFIVQDRRGDARRSVQDGLFADPEVGRRFLMRRVRS